MTTTDYPMTRIAANALVLATLVLAARAVAFVVTFVAGWHFDTGLLLLVLLAGLATAVGVFGTAVFGFALVVQTLRRRVHPRYVTALVVIVALWIASFLLPPAYLSGMAWSLWAKGVDEKTLIDFAAASRARVPDAATSRVDRELRFGSDRLRVLQNSHRRIFETLPRDARVFIAADSVNISWGGSMPGTFGLAVYDRVEPSAISIEPSAQYRRIAPRVFVSQHHD